MQVLAFATLAPIALSVLCQQLRFLATTPNDGSEWLVKQATNTKRWFGSLVCARSAALGQVDRRHALELVRAAAGPVVTDDGAHAGGRFERALVLAESGRGGAGG